MPSDRCPVLSYCGQMAGWIKMPLGMEVGLGPSHIVLDGDPDIPPQRDIVPNFWSTSTEAKRSPISPTAEHLYKFAVEFASKTIFKLEYGPMPNVMVALPNTGGALCSTPQSLADAHYLMPCSNAAKTRNPLKFARVPQTTGWISAVSRPKFTIL